MSADVTSSNDPFLTIAEVAAMTRLSKMTIYREVAAGRLVASKFGRKTYRIRESSARDWLDAASQAGEPA